MNNKISTSLMIAALALMTSCKFEQPMPVINPDPVFEQSGLQKFETNAIYEDFTTEVTIVRTAGLSKEITLNFSIDAALIEEQNNINQTSYKLLDEKYYEMASSAVMPASEKTLTVPVTIKPSAIVKDLGLEAANNLVIPIVISGADMAIEDAGLVGRILLTPVIDLPRIEVADPELKPELSFIPTIPLTQTVELLTLSNFTTLNAGKVTYRPSMDRVDEYNEENGTEYKPLPADTYTINDGVFNEESLTMTSEIVFDCAGIGGTDTYLLPLELAQTGSDYNIENAGPIYVIVNLSELKVKVDSEFETTATGKGLFSVSFNSPMPDDQTVSVKYDPSLIEAYNDANGTSYKTLDEDKIEFTGANVVAGNLGANIEYTVDIVDLPYDTDVYLVPLTIDMESVLEGTVLDTPSTVYIEVKKSLTGDYQAEAGTATVLGTEDWTWKLLQIPAIYLCDAAHVPDNTEKNQKYYFIYGGTGWKDGFIFFNISDEPMHGKEDCVKLVDFQDRVNTGNPGNGYDEIINNSYLNTKTGEIVIDCLIKGVWAPDPTGNDQTKGYWICAKFNR